LKERYLKYAAVLPDIPPAASVSSVDVCLATLYHQEEPVSIQSCKMQGYQDIYRFVVDLMFKTLWSAPFLQPCAVSEGQAAFVEDPQLLFTGGDRAA